MLIGSDWTEVLPKSKGDFQAFNCKKKTKTMHFTLREPPENCIYFALLLCSSGGGGGGGNSSID
jgi:hypothetical protein